MYLKRLEIQGFKSFANKTTLEFETGMTAVVGPNGSGKSNIADAIRWVLGEQSSKQLRGKKSEDVIFAGSEKKGRLSFAEVSVTFDNADHRIPVDYAEVAITRRIDRSGESDYLINGNKVRLLDIVDLILKSNIGTSRYTVIGQGTIDQMILAGPSEIKNLIDEASGVKTYYMRREKTLKRLEQTTQNLLRVQDLLQEIEPRLKSLRRQAKRMEERESIEMELHQIQKQFYVGKYLQLQHSVQSIAGTLEAYAMRRQALDTEINTLRGTIDASESGNRDEIEAYQKIQQEIRSMQDRKNKILEDAAMVRGKLQANTAAAGNAAELQLEQSRLQAEVHQLRESISRSSASGAQIAEQAKARKAKFDEISARLGELQQALERPRDLSSTRFAEDLHATDVLFEDLYATLDSNPGQLPTLEVLVSGVREFRGAWQRFKDRAVRFVQDPFEEFDRQRESLQLILKERDTAAQELNAYELQLSKHNLDATHFEQELAKAERRLLQISLDLQHAQSTDNDAYLRELAASEAALQAEVNGIAAEIATLENKISEYHASEQSRKHALLDTERHQRQLQDELSKLRDAESGVQVQKAVLDTQMQTVLDEARAAIGPEDVQRIESIGVSSPNMGSSAEIVMALGIDESLEKLAEAGAITSAEAKIIKLKGQLQMIGGIDELTIKEYHETETRYAYLHSQVEDLQKGISDLRLVIDELDGHIKKRFQGAFEQIDEKFQNYFRILFNGGRAYLSLVKAGATSGGTGNTSGAENGNNSKNGVDQSDDQDDSSQDHVAASGMRPEEKILQKYEQGSDLIVGIDIKATPPGKKLATISALSGGERALTSIALLCALLTCFPSPFVVLDEVDAALDEANTVRFAQILGKISDQTQFVTVTHNRETMREAHTLYGVTMGDDSVSKVLSLKMEQAQQYAK